MFQEHKTIKKNTIAGNDLVEGLISDTLYK